MTLGNFCLKKPVFRHYSDRAFYSGCFEEANSADYTQFICYRKIIKIMSLTIEKFEYLDDRNFDLVYATYSKIFDPPHPSAKLRNRSANKEEYLVLLAKVNDEVVGLKVGFPEDGYFHSWIGGVIPEYRGQGIARKMTEVQHDWARNRGYKAIKTHTDHRFNNMIIHNIRNGFEILETQTRQDSGIKKIIMTKTL